MITVCENHLKEALNFFNVPHVQKLSHKYWEHSCILCSKPAHFKLFSILPLDKSLLLKTKDKSAV
ncbi:hypothetical protein [Bacillus sp. ISL-7]|uniref:hypothetical protein n=1 Tax=Bacillus sp. ISL-7 TaxID=2819136 RepID=UPI001BED053B|nr:hypothetical protein [Bacillus sp. ISL-7]MBT2735000.1 hypothetical protein [Bacillus sp. ISL-7]